MYIHGGRCPGNVLPGEVQEGDGVFGDGSPPRHPGLPAYAGPGARPELPTAGRRPIGDQIDWIALRSRANRRWPGTKPTPDCVGLSDCVARLHAARAAEAAADPPTAVSGPWQSSYVETLLPQLLWQQY